jgi:hypothetical protein
MILCWRPRGSVVTKRTQIVIQGYSHKPNDPMNWKRGMGLHTTSGRFGRRRSWNRLIERLRKAPYSDAGKRG